MTARLTRFVRDQSGAAAVEFGLVGAIFCFLMVACGTFGLALFQYISLQEAVGIGARQLASSVADTSPYSDAVTAIDNAAPGLTSSSLTITITINGSACTTDTTCSSLMAGGVAANVTGSYPCNLSVMGYDFFPGCSFTSSATELTE